MNARPWLFALLCALLGASWAASPILASDFHSAQPGIDEPDPSAARAPDLYRVYFSTHQSLSALAGNHDVWEVNHEEGYALVLLSDAQASALLNSGYRVELELGRSAILVAPPVAGASTDAGIPGFACYRTVEETYVDLAALAASRPDLVEWVDIGDSWDKTQAGGPVGYDLRTLVLTNRARDGEKFRFFLIAAIHARELATAELAARFAEHLVANYGVDPDITWLLDYGEVHIVPVANPDGRKFAEQLLYWRKNTNSGDGCPLNQPFYASYGVDLNRNSSFKWAQCEGASCSSSNACATTFRGSAASSEPETQAIQNYASTLFADQRGAQDEDAAPDATTGLFISVHSYGRLVLFPWGWRAAASPNHDQLATLGRKFAHYNSYRVCQAGAAGCLYQTDGTTDDWAYGELGVAAFTFEIGNQFFESCTSFEQSILDDNIAALLFGFKAARQPYLAPAGPEIVDVTLDRSRVSVGSVISLTALVDNTRVGDQQASASMPTVQAASYSLDEPVWISGTFTTTLAALDSAFDHSAETVVGAIDTSGWALGRHTIFVSGRNSDGFQGVPSARFVEVVAANWGVTIAPGNISQTARPGGSAAYSITITNSGVLSDSYDIRVEDNLWPVHVVPLVGPLEAGSSTMISVTVDAPALPTSQNADSARIIVTSANDQSQFATVEIETTVQGFSLFAPWLRGP